MSRIYTISMLETFSLVVPVFNEEERLGAALPHVCEVVEHDFPNSEIIYVDDGSTDSTFSLLLEEQKSRRILKVIRNSRNRGKGHAVRCGLKAAAGDLVLFSDADFS